MVILSASHAFRAQSEVIAPIGAGGMGEVYRAQDTRLNRLVAIKVLPAPSATRTESRERFEREARAISSFSHPTSAACTTSTEHLSSLPIEILVSWPALLSHATRP